MYPLGTWFVSGICVWLPWIKKTMIYIIIIIIIELTLPESHIPWWSHRNISHVHVSIRENCGANLTCRLIKKIQQGVKIFLFSKLSISTLGSTQAFIQWVPPFFPGSNAAGAWWTRHTSSGEIKNEYSYTSTPITYLHSVGRGKRNLFFKQKMITWINIFVS